MNRNQNKNHPKGIVAVEAALVLPVLITITLIGLQYGWLFLKLQEITNISRQYVRYAVRPEIKTSADYSDLYDDMIAELAKLGINKDPDIDSTETKILYSNTVGDPIAVQISLIGDQVDIINFFPVPSRLRAHAVMSKEGPGP